MAPPAIMREHQLHQQLTKTTQTSTAQLGQQSGSNLIYSVFLMGWHDRWIFVVNLHEALPDHESMKNDITWRHDLCKSQRKPALAL